MGHSKRSFWHHVTGEGRELPFESEKKKTKTEKPTVLLAVFPTGTTLLIGLRFRVTSALATQNPNCPLVATNRPILLDNSPATRRVSTACITRRFQGGGAIFIHGWGSPANRHQPYRQQRLEALSAASNVVQCGIILPA